MQENLFKRITQWNADRDNTHFNLWTESRMLVEEIYESIHHISSKDDKPGYKSYIKQEAQLFAERHLDKDKSNLSDFTQEQIADMADAYGDLIFIAVGSIFKLGYDPEKVLKAICDANDKKGNKKDADGKIIKDSTFVEPVLE